MINENDTVSVDEIRFGDNALLAALVANAVDADLTVIFSDVHGLYDGETKRTQDSLDGILAGRPVGRPLLPTAERLDHRERWIAYSLWKAGVIEVKADVADAITVHGRSLRSSGITACNGNFESGVAAPALRSARVRAARRCRQP